MNPHWLIRHALMAPCLLLLASCQSSTLSSRDDTPSFASLHAHVSASDEDSGSRTSNVWRGKHVFTVRFLSGSPQLHQRVLDVASDWSKACNVRFVKVESGRADIRIAFAPGGHWSCVGTVARTKPQSKPTVNFSLSETTSNYTFRGVVLHEFGHVLGLRHPRTNVQWNEEAVIRYYQGGPNQWTKEQIRSNVLSRYSGASGGSTGDLKSVMQYPIKPGLAKGAHTTTWNQKLSAGDIRVIQSLYGKPR